MAKIQTINDWKPETSALLHRIALNNCNVLWVSNGEEKLEAAKATRAELIEHLISTDEGAICIERAGRRVKLFLVYGNSPGELVADWSWKQGEADPAFIDVIIDDHYRVWSEKKQPTLRGYYGLKGDRYQFIPSELPEGAEVAS